VVSALKLMWRDGLRWLLVAGLLAWSALLVRERCRGFDLWHAEKRLQEQRACLQALNRQIPPGTVLAWDFGGAPGGRLSSAQEAWLSQVRGAVHPAQAVALSAEGLPRCDYLARLGSGRAEVARKLNFDYALPDWDFEETPAPLILVRLRATTSPAAALPEKR
jgi:hypothetical protein